MDVDCHFHTCRIFNLFLFKQDFPSSNMREVVKLKLSKIYDNSYQTCPTSTSPNFSNRLNHNSSNPVIVTVIGDFPTKTRLVKPPTPSNLPRRFPKPQPSRL